MALGSDPSRAASNELVNLVDELSEARVAPLARLGYVQVMERDDDIDQRKLLRRGPSYGPNWDAAIEFGIDVTLIEDNLAMTMEERLIQSCKLTRQLEALREAYEATHAGQ